QDYAVDPLRIYATGMSNGGGMSYRLACEASDLFAAVAPISAAPSQRSECSSATAISILAMHGSADQHVPLNGGYGAKSLQPRDDPAFREYLQGWATRLKCGDAPTESEDGLLTRLDWSNPQTGVEVRGIIIDGAGHQWPGGAPGWRGGDEPSMAIDANATMWEFFQRHPKP
ncbi:MAG: polyhydroxybutyrate depolymerase, partial [bacterium]